MSDQIGVIEGSFAEEPLTTGATNLPKRGIWRQMYKPADNASMLTACKSIRCLYRNLCQVKAQLHAGS